jgi:DNA-binding PadR family transcriptional regulator
MSTRSFSLLPLSPASLHILLALAPADLHGYGIMREIARQSEGHYRMGPGTLYDNLRKLFQQGLIEEAAPPSTDDDPRRRYYRLNAAGRELLAMEVQRLETVLREARAHLPTLSPRRT